MKTIETQVLIIGGGATGTGLARDLALRGVHSILVEKKDINAGASGANHGLLHSGGRYVSNDEEAARECREEGDILRKTAGNCIEDTGGMFLAVEGDEESYIADFPGHCEKSGISCNAVDLKECRELEPSVSEKVIAAYEVNDATVDPFKLSLLNMTHATALQGSILMRRTKIISFAQNNGVIEHTVAKDLQTGEKIRIVADQIVNAAGAWAGEIAAMAGACIDMAYSSGLLIVSNERLNTRVLNRLRPPGDGDILVPGGTVSILGTTSTRLETPEPLPPTIREVELNIQEGAKMAPILNDTRFIRAYCGVRPLVRVAGADGDRSVSRGFTLAAHEDAGLKNFCTITGGKLTTFRLMAERTADLVCERLGVDAPCRTRTEILPEISSCQWTEPAFGPEVWAANPSSSEDMLCECEMVSTAAVDTILKGCSAEQIYSPESGLGLRALGLRSRIGKGSCQGAFCGLRVGAYLYDKGELNSYKHLQKIKDFFDERYRGQRPVLWGAQLAQMELAEAMHCGFLGLEKVNLGGDNE
ncbi:MAG: FAD-dependent oxidoreductase [Desulfovibrio sp.]